MQNNTQKQLLAILGLIILGVASRIIPHAPNLTAVAAATLIAGAYLPKRVALAVPILIMLISDAIIGFHTTVFWVYGSYMLIAVLGIYSGKKYIMVTPLASSLLFFIITNFGVWTTGTMYSMDIGGLVDCYTMALPFFRGTVTGDIVYTIVLVGIFEMIRIYQLRATKPLARVI